MTAGSLATPPRPIVEVGGAKNVYACASHGVLSGPALERVTDSYIKELALLNTIPVEMGAGARRSSICPSLPCSPRPSSAFIRKFPSRSCSTEKFCDTLYGTARSGGPICFLLIFGGYTMLFGRSGGISWLVVGLGNPGTQYESTRHNMGFLAVDKLAQEENFRFSKLRFKAWTATWEVGRAEGAPS